MTAKADIHTSASQRYWEAKAHLDAVPRGPLERSARASILGALAPWQTPLVRRPAATPNEVRLWHLARQTWGRRCGWAAAIRHLRGSRGMDQQALADGAGMSRSQVSAVEVGIKDPRWSTIVRLLDCLDVRVVVVPFDARVTVIPPDPQAPALEGAHCTSSWSRGGPVMVEPCMPRDEGDT